MRISLCRLQSSRHCSDSDEEKEYDNNNDDDDDDNCVLIHASETVMRMIVML